MSILFTQILVSRVPIIFLFLFLRILQFEISSDSYFLLRAGEVCMIKFLYINCSFKLIV
jgi:hypothetical protein